MDRKAHVACGCGITYAGRVAVNTAGEAVKKASHAAGGAVQTARQSAAKACQSAKESLKAKGKSKVRATSHRRPRAGPDTAALAAMAEVHTTVEDEVEVAPIAASAVEAVPQRRSGLKRLTRWVKGKAAKA